MSIVAAVDGSSLGNPGPAGWAWVVSDDVWAAGGWPEATNNIAELTALLRLLQDTEEAGFADEPLLVLADSQYVLNSVTKWMPGWKARGWKKADGKPVANQQLLVELDQALAGRNVEYEWVRGHTGHELNEGADLRARAAAEAYQLGKPVPSGPAFTNRIGATTAFAAVEERKREPELVALSADAVWQQWDMALDSARKDPLTITQPGQDSLLLLDADLGWRALAALDQVEGTRR